MKMLSKRLQISSMTVYKKNENKFMKLLTLLLFIFASSCSARSPEVSNYYRVANIVNKQVRREIPVTDDGPGAMIPDKIHAYSTIFHHEGPISIEQSRRFVLRIAQISLSKFNEDSAIQPYLESAPFTINNLAFSIYSSSWMVFDAPEDFVDCVAFSFGKIHYKRHDLESDQFIILFSENYEEALEKCPSFKPTTKQ